MKQENTDLLRHKLTVARLLRVLCLMVLILGTYKACTFTAPLQYGDPRGAVGSLMGDDAMANYDVALKMYRDKRYRHAAEFAKSAQNALINEQGEMAEADKLRGAQILFLSGLIYEEQEEYSQAVDAYKEALRLDPTHKFAKYNLERLLQPGKSPGKAPGDGNGKDNKKGI